MYFNSDILQGKIEGALNNQYGRSLEEVQKTCGSDDIPAELFKEECTLLSNNCFCKYGA